MVKHEFRVIVDDINIIDKELARSILEKAVQDFFGVNARVKDVSKIIVTNDFLARSNATQQLLQNRFVASLIQLNRLMNEEQFQEFLQQFYKEKE